jgi:hypothetical protein
VRVVPGASVEGTFQYLGMGDVSTRIPSVGRQPLNTSGLILGISFVMAF